MRRSLLICVSLCIILLTSAQEDNYFTAQSSYDLVLQDILETLIERDPSVDIQAIEEELYELHQHPVNLNRATAADLEKLPFLSLDQVDAILLYCYHYPLHSVNDLSLIHCLKDYEITNLLPFVCVLPPDETDHRTMADLFHTANHEVDLRLDVRNIEHYSGDPVYGYVRYKLNAGNKILFGTTFQRNAGEIPSAHSRYGAYLQLNNIGPFRTIMVGDYRASFGLGLVLNDNQPLGKSSYAANLGMTKQGLYKYNGTSQNFMRGVGATVRLGEVDMTAFYSYRQPDSLYRQMAGLNLTYQHNRLRVGTTAVEYWTRQPVPMQDNYYNLNYFRGQRQASISVNVQYAFRQLTLLGEWATSQNTQWGFAALMGARYTPVQDISLLLLLRHYSRTYDPVSASTFSETSRPNDEQGVYLGMEIKRLQHWKFSTYADLFRFSGPKYMIRTYPSWGLDLYAQADYYRSRALSMSFRTRAKHKASLDKLTFRYQITNTIGSVSFRTQADMAASYAPSSDVSSITLGGMVSEQFDYHPARLPLVAQLRIEAFYLPDWNNRIYAYENDVLYAYSIPSVYGIGMRYYANLRYRFNDHYSLYLKLSDTWYARQWVTDKNLPAAHTTDLHLLLRITY